MYSTPPIQLVATPWGTQWKDYAKMLVSPGLQQTIPWELQMQLDSFNMVLTSSSSWPGQVIAVSVEVRTYEMVSDDQKKTLSSILNSTTNATDCPPPQKREKVGLEQTLPHAQTQLFELQSSERDTSPP